MRISRGLHRVVASDAASLSNPRRRSTLAERSTAPTLWGSVTWSRTTSARSFASAIFDQFLKRRLDERIAFGKCTLMHRIRAEQPIEVLWAKPAPATKLFRPTRRSGADQHSGLDTTWLPSVADCAVPHLQHVSRTIGFCHELSGGLRRCLTPAGGPGWFVSRSGLASHSGSLLHPGAESAHGLIIGNS